MTPAEARQAATQKLSQKRLRHVENVVDAARRLALRYHADVAAAEVAAWLHDIAKEEDSAALLQLMAQDAIIAKSTSERPKATWHGPCGAVFAKHALGETDADVLDAIACHTTGRVGMTQLDKILYVADAISAERDYPGVERLRQLAFDNLDEAVLAAMRESMAYVEHTGQTLDPETRRAYEALQREVRQSRGKDGGNPI